MDFYLVFDVGDIGGRARGHVVEDRDLVAFANESITEVRTDKTGSTGDENAHGRKSMGADIDFSWLALSFRSGISQVSKGSFSYAIAGDFPQAFRRRHRLGGLVVGRWVGPYLGVAGNDYAP